LCARQAVAKYHSTPEDPLTEDVSKVLQLISIMCNIFLQDVIITCGCAGALEFCSTVLGNPGQNILIPIPNHPLESCVAVSRGLKAHHYQLLVRFQSI